MRYTVSNVKTNLALLRTRREERRRGDVN